MAEKMPRKTADLKFELVLKCDSIGSAEAVSRSIGMLAVPRVAISIIRTGVGAVNKSDILVAETANRLILGFQVGPVPGLEKTLKEHGVELRIYDVIYRLTEDVKQIAENLRPVEAQDEITGTALVIALFKSSRRSVILGCEIKSGFLAVGQHFRIISAMGPFFSGTIDSLHIAERAVQKGVTGQHVGIKIRDFTGAKVGDILETFRPAPLRKEYWKPSAGVLYR